MGDPGTIVSSGHANNGSATQTGETVENLAELIPPQDNCLTTVLCCTRAFLCVHMGTHVCACAHVSAVEA